MSFYNLLDEWWSKNKRVATEALGAEYRPETRTKQAGWYYKKTDEPAWQLCPDFLGDHRKAFKAAEQFGLFDTDRYCSVLFFSQEGLWTVVWYMEPVEPDESDELDGSATGETVPEALVNAMLAIVEDRK